MAINLVEICRLKYPGQIEAGNINFREPEDVILIGEWNVPGIDRPKESDLLLEASNYENTYQLNQLQITCQHLIESHVEEIAKARQYSSAVSCASYNASTNPQWKAEAEAFIAWRDSVYAYAIGVIALVQAGGAIPTSDEVMSGLPIMVWPN